MQLKYFFLFFTYPLTIISGSSGQRGLQDVFEHACVPSSLHVELLKQASSDEGLTKDTYSESCVKFLSLALFNNDQNKFSVLSRGIQEISDHQIKEEIYKKLAKKVIWFEWSKLDEKEFTSHESIKKKLEVEGLFPEELSEEIAKELLYYSIRNGSNHSIIALLKALEVVTPGFLSKKFRARTRIPGKNDIACNFIEYFQMLYDYGIESKRLIQFDPAKSYSDREIIFKLAEVKKAKGSLFIIHDDPEVSCTFDSLYALARVAKVMYEIEIDNLS